MIWIKSVWIGDDVVLNMHIDPVLFIFAFASRVMHRHYIEHNGRAFSLTGIVSHTSSNPKTKLPNVRFIDCLRLDWSIFQLVGHTTNQWKAEISQNAWEQRTQAVFLKMTAMANDQVKWSAANRKHSVENSTTWSSFAYQETLWWYIYI